ncbi:hypothetical protein [Chenggangzhangella methanolivorans]|uniref:Uncharacterized protein n=1 Tax=Chenggangzhangella methanolivorans TaxID=1437009 RepID=A0A9E6R5J1_9HYPH|nr:hypothetical protein [Chenggangzhangella methanolivorans]QZN98239.1 hypothetical protein K6K41_13845 [Chenggangzhangella methanolivorans]
MIIAGYEELLVLAFGVALAVFVLTRLNSGLSRRERKELTSTHTEA